MHWVESGIDSDDEPHTRHSSPTAFDSRFTGAAAAAPLATNLL